MVKYLGFHRSDKPEKKYFVEVEGHTGRHKRIYFGSAGMSDYTTFPADIRDKRRSLYLTRHRAHENWNDPMTAGFWSRHILWGNTPSVKTNLANTLKRYGLSSSN